MKNPVVKGNRWLARHTAVAKAPVTQQSCRIARPLRTAIGADDDLSCGFHQDFRARARKIDRDTRCGFTMMYCQPKGRERTWRRRPRHDFIVGICYLRFPSLTPRISRGSTVPWKCSHEKRRIADADVASLCGRESCCLDVIIVDVMLCG